MNEELALTVFDFFDGHELTRPDLTPAEAETVAADLFGISGTVRELGSNQDRNFRIDTPTPDGITSYLLKVDNGAFSEQELMAQDAAMAHLSARGLRVPVPIAGLDGNSRQRWQSGDGTLSVRMLTFLDGVPLASQQTFTPDMVSALGTLSGAVARELADFDSDGLDRSLQWDLRNAARVVDRLASSVTDDDRRQQVVGAAAAAAARLAPISGQLRVQAVHGDITDDNVLGEERDGQLIPSGVIDFGDLATGWLVAEIAVTTSSLLHHLPGDVTEAIAAIAAFDKVVPLTDDEIAALWPLVVLRGAVLVVSGEHQLRIDGVNDYAAERTSGEWQLFEAALGLDPDDAERAIRTALGRPAWQVPAILYGIAADDVELLDFSVTAPALNDGRWLQQDAEWTMAGEALTRAAVVAAPYGQYRLTRSEPNTTAEPRTLALGWEIFTASGASVVAPGEFVVAGIAADSVSLSLDDGELRIRGVQPSVTAGDRVEAGAPLGTVLEQRDGVGRLFVQQVAAGHPEVPEFVTPAEADEWMAVAVDPASAIGMQPVPSPFDTQGELDRRARIFASAQERYYLNPPQIERGWKEFLVGTDGRVYLDMVNNVAAIGHSHPRQVQAVTHQLGLLNTNSRFLYRALADLSERLVELAPDPSLDTVLLVNSGTEAVDLALRLAQVFTGRRPVVALREAYHGWSIGADAVTTSAYDNPFALANRPDWVEVADIPNPYRGRYRGADSAASYLADLRAQLDAMAEEGRDPAGFICETVLGNAGGVVMPGGYLAGAYEEIRSRGGVCIADEVQVGYGRLGNHFWGVEQQGVVPDIISVAKAMGNGFPLGAVITRREIAEALSREGNFFSSAGGSPVSCAAGLAVLDVIRDENLQANAAAVGDHLVARLQELAERHPIIGAVHGMGLYLGIELVRSRESLEPATEETAAVCERLLHHGVIMQATSERQNVLKVKPPLCLSLASADFFVDALDLVLTRG
jgi:4-aminobutyrate aminotransferase-like enzyme/Ser/Thr protein kinase RdoA (MazF antagonist)